jgi:hypothetical protein
MTTHHHPDREPAEQIIIFPLHETLFMIGFAGSSSPHLEARHDGRTSRWNPQDSAGAACALALQRWQKC